MQKKYNADVRVKHEVISIDREGQTVEVRRPDTSEVYRESHDTLAPSTGSSSARPPIPGIASPRIKTLRTVPDTDATRAMIRKRNISTEVIGGCFIGLEMAENLRHAGFRVAVIEMLEQVMALLDYEMAQLPHEAIAENGVEPGGVVAYLGDAEESNVNLFL